jgi:hypothetical protein
MAGVEKNTDSPGAAHHRKVRRALPDLARLTLGISPADRVRAEQASAAVDEIIRNPEAAASGSPEDMALFETARRLARLPALLRPMDAALEQRILHGHARRALRAPQKGTGRAGRKLLIPWAVAGLAVVLLAAALFTPFGQTAAANFRAVFRLGRTEVRVTPPDAAGAPAIAPNPAAATRMDLTLAEAEQQVPFALLRPATLPTGYDLKSATGYSFPGLPAWVPQPFAVELLYADDQGHEVSLRMYPITLGDKDRLNTSALNLEATPIQEVQEVDVRGRPGVLLRLSTESGQATWQEVVWEQGNLILSLSSSDLSEDGLLAVARSVR